MALMNHTKQNDLNLSPEEKRARLAELLRAKAGMGKKIPLSFAQRRLWFLDQLDPGSSAYNLPRAARLIGPLNLQALRQSLNALVQRHDSLRTNFVADQGDPAQIVSPSREIEMPVIELEGLSLTDRESEARRLAAIASRIPFDLAYDQLLRATLTGATEMKL